MRSIGLSYWSPNCSCSVSSVASAAPASVTTASAVRIAAQGTRPAILRLSDDPRKREDVDRYEQCRRRVREQRENQPAHGERPPQQRGPFERRQEGVNAGDLKHHQQRVVPDALRPEQMPGTEDEEHERGQRDLVSGKAPDAPPRQPQRGDAGQRRDQPRGSRRTRPPPRTRGRAPRSRAEMRGEMVCAGSVRSRSTSLRRTTGSSHRAGRAEGRRQRAGGPTAATRDTAQWRSGRAAVITRCSR